MQGFDFIVAEVEQAPTRGKLFAANESCRNQVETFRADALFGLEAEGFGAVGEEVRARDFALDQNGVARALPSNGVRHLATDTGLLGEHYSAAVAAQPVDGFRD